MREEIKDAVHLIRNDEYFGKCRIPNREVRELDCSDEVRRKSHEQDDELLKIYDTNPPNFIYHINKPQAWGKTLLGLLTVGYSITWLMENHSFPCWVFNRKYRDEKKPVILGLISGSEYSSKAQIMRHFSAIIEDSPYLKSILIHKTNQEFIFPKDIIVRHFYENDLYIFDNNIVGGLWDMNHSHTPSNYFQIRDHILSNADYYLMYHDSPVKFIVARRT